MHGCGRFAGEPPNGCTLCSVLGSVAGGTAIEATVSSTGPGAVAALGALIARRTGRFHPRRAESDVPLIEPLPSFPDFISSDDLDRPPPEPSRRNYLLIAPVSGLALAQRLMDLRGVRRDWNARRLRLAARACRIVMLISVVGVRIVPGFTRNWLTQRGETRPPPMPDRPDRWAQWLLNTALSAGAIGSMILGVMTRISWDHTGRALVANRPTFLFYILVVRAARLRIAAALPSTAEVDLLRAPGLNHAVRLDRALRGSGNVERVMLFHNRDTAQHPGPRATQRAMKA